MREGRKGERLEARRPPILPRGERLFLKFRPKHVPELPSSSSSSNLPRRFTLFGEWAGPSWMLALSVAYLVHAKRMKSVQGVEGVYYVMMSGASIGLCVVMKHPLRVSWELMYGVNSLDAKASADNLSGSSYGRFSCSASPSSLSTLSRRKLDTTHDLPFLIFVITILPASPFLADNAQRGCLIVEEATVSEDALVARFSIVPTPVFKSATNSVLGTGLLGGRSQRGGFPSSKPC